MFQSVEAREAVERNGYKYIEINPKTDAFYLDKNIKIEFSAI